MAKRGLEFAVATLVLVSGCTAPPAKKPVPAAPAPPPPVIAPPPIATPPPAAPTAAVAPAPDTCGAQALQYLVGKPHTDIPVPLAPSSRRVICSSCVATQDFKPYRQTITYDSQTGLVTSVKCG